VVARALEESGLATVHVTQLREHTLRVKPPRALFVPFPFGRPLGAADDPALQLRVIRAALALFAAPAAPVLVECDGDDPYAGQEIAIPQASGVAPTARLPLDAADELTALRRSYEAFVAAHGGRTAVGFTGVPQRRFRALVRFLEAYANSEEADLPERPPEVTVPRFLRLAADDLKAFYLEARVHDHPAEPFGDLDRWLWGTTALGALLRRVRDRLKASGDPALDAVAFGIAR